jgi:hypothetical protein
MLDGDGPLTQGSDTRTGASGRRRPVVGWGGTHAQQSARGTAMSDEVPPAGRRTGP